MSLEEEHEALHRRGEMIKFMVLVLALVGTVFAIALLRPLIFDRIVPAVLGWEQPADAPEATAPEQPVSDDVAPATTGGEEGSIPVIMTATPGAEGGDREDLGAPLPTPRLYEVQAGDSLARIAEQFDLSVEALVQANGISDPERIQVGDVLVIPEP